MKMRRLLIADNSEWMKYSLVEILCERYQVVGIVSDGEELVQLAERVLPDAVVTDISMAPMNGPSARRKLIARQLAIPFVFVSALGKEAVQMVPNDAPVAFVHKFEMFEHLLTAVSAVLSGQRYLSPYYRDNED